MCFCECRYLESVVLGISSPLKYIGASCFACSRLLGFSLPASLVHIGDGAFIECPLSAGLMIPENCPMLDLSATENHRSSALLLSKDNNICYSSLGIHQTIAIPLCVEAIASRCFSCSHTLSWLGRRGGGSRDSSLKHIGARAFWMSSKK